MPIIIIVKLYRVLVNSRLSQPSVVVVHNIGILCLICCLLHRIQLDLVVVSVCFMRVLTIFSLSPFYGDVRNDRLT